MQNAKRKRLDEILLLLLLLLSLLLLVVIQHCSDGFSKVITLVQRVSTLLLAFVARAFLTERGRTG